MNPREQAAIFIMADNIPAVIDADLRHDYIVSARLWASTVTTYADLVAFAPRFPAWRHCWGMMQGQVEAVDVLAAKLAGTAGVITLADGGIQ